MEFIIACALALIAFHIASAIFCPNPLAAIALVDVPVLYLCRYLLIHRDISGAGAGAGRLRFLLGAAVAIIYMSLFVVLFLRFAPSTPWWGALAAWVIILLIAEAVFAFFFFPYRCFYYFSERPGREADVENQMVHVITDSLY